MNISPITTLILRKISKGCVVSMEAYFCTARGGLGFSRPVGDYYGRAEFHNGPGNINV